MRNTSAETDILARVCEGGSEAWSHDVAHTCLCVCDRHHVLCQGEMGKRGPPLHSSLLGLTKKSPPVLWGPKDVFESQF